MMPTERMQPVEAALLARYDHLLVADPRQFSMGLQNGAYVRVQKPFTTAVRDQMLRGRLTVALYCLTPDQKAIQGIVDSDREGGLTDLQQAALALREVGLTPLLEASRRGGHLRIFHEPVDPDVTVGLLGKVLETVGVTAEVFPRGRGLSSVRAPLSPHPVSRRWYPFVDVDSLQPVGNTVMTNLRHLMGFTRAGHEQLAEALAKVITPRRRLRPAEGSIAQPAQGKPDILAVVGADRVIEKAGKNFRTLCPFHADKTPSLILYPETNSWYCFSCRKGGDSIRFLALRQGVSDGDILRQLRGNHTT